MKAFVIIRVSSQDQLKGYGPDAQWDDDPDENPNRCKPYLNPLRFDNFE